MQYQGVTDIESVKDCCWLNHHACCGVSRKNERYVTVWFEVTVFRKCVCEIIRADEKSMAPLKLKLWGVLGATSVYYLSIYLFVLFIYFILLFYLFIHLFIYLFMFF